MPRQQLKHMLACRVAMDKGVITFVHPVKVCEESAAANARDAIHRHVEAGMTPELAWRNGESPTPVSELGERRVSCKGLMVTVQPDDGCNFDDDAPIEQQLHQMKQHMRQEAQERRREAQERKREAQELQSQISQERLHRAKWVLRNTAAQVLLEPVKGEAQDRVSTWYRNHIGELQPCAAAAGCTARAFADAADRVINRRNHTMHPTDLDSDISECLWLLEFDDIQRAHVDEAKCIRAAALVRKLKFADG